PREAGLIGRVEIGAPLQLHALTGTGFKSEGSCCRSGIDPQTARKKGRPGNGREDFRGGAAESAMARDVTGKGRGNKGLLLIREPIRGQPPAGAAVLDGRIGRLSCGGSDEFDEVRHERKAVGMIRRTGRLAGLAKLAHVANELDRTPAI